MGTSITSLFDPNVSPCFKCPTPHCAIPGAGSMLPIPDHKYNRRVMFLGEAPGVRDTLNTGPFSGYAGREFNERLLPYHLGALRQHVWMTNVTKCCGARDPYIDDRVPFEVMDACASKHLRQEFETMQPDVVVAMGSVAASIFTEERTGEQLTWEWHRGKSWWCHTTYYSKRVLVFVVTHPAFGVRDPEQLRWIDEDFRLLCDLLNTKDMQATGLVDTTELGYLRVSTAAEVDEYFEWCGDLCKCSTEDLVLGLDSEDMEDGSPFCISASAADYTGVMVKLEDVEALNKIAEYVPLIGMVGAHHMLHDLPVFQALGIDLSMRDADTTFDTILTAYHSQWDVQSLKKLIFRKLGMRQFEYEELIDRHFSKLVGPYFSRYTEHQWGKPPKIWENGKEKQPQSPSTKMKLAMTHLAKNPKTDLRKRWNNWSEWDRAEITKRLGKFPPYDLRCVPEHDQVTYSVGDADGCRRLYLHNLQDTKLWSV